MVTRDVARDWLSWGWFGRVRGRESGTQKPSFQWAVQHMFSISRTFARGLYRLMMSEAHVLYIGAACNNNNNNNNNNSNTCCADTEQSAGSSNHGRPDYWGRTKTEGGVRISSRLPRGRSWHHGSVWHLHPTACKFLHRSAFPLISSAICSTQSVSVIWCPNRHR